MPEEPTLSPIQQSPQERNLARFGAILKTIEDTVNKDDFEKFVKQILEIILQIEQKNTATQDTIVASLQQVLAKMQGDHSTTLSDLKKQVNDVFVSNRLSSIEADLHKKVDARLATVKDGYTPKKGIDYFDGKPGVPGKTINGKDAIPVDEQAMYNRVMAMCQPMMDKMDRMMKAMASSSANRGGARSSHAMKVYNLSSYTNGTLKVFSVPKNVVGFVISSDFPTILMENAGFTKNAATTTITLTTDNAPSSGSQLSFIYSEVFNT